MPSSDERTHPPPPAGLDAAVRAFRATLERLDRSAGAIEPPGRADAALGADGRYPLPQPPSHVLAEAVPGAARSLALDSELGERAALLAVAGQVWHRHLGPLLTSGDLQKLGDRSRQAVHDLVSRGRLLALPARGGSLFPAFQVDRQGRPRPGMSEVLAAFEGAAESPLTIASWFRTPQPLLDDRTPADWLVAGEDVSRLVAAARRAAAHLGG